MVRVECIGALAVAGVIGIGCRFDSSGTSNDAYPRESDDATTASDDLSSDADGSSSFSGGSGPAESSEGEGTDTGSCTIIPFYGDADGDGFGRDDAMVMACSAPEGHADRAGDCDDDDADANPDALETCNGRDDDCDDAIDEWSEAWPEDDTCNGCAVTPSATNLYYVCMAESSWTDAVTQCEARGATLASIADQAENDFLVDLLDVHGLPWAWIGLSDLEREAAFTWLDGSSFEYTQWGGWQPDDSNGNQDCVMLGRGPRQWFDRQCHNPDNPDDQKARGFVCKTAAP